MLDVETDGLQATPDKFIFGCIYGHNYRKVLYSVQEFKDVLFSGLFKNKYIFAHNAEFDYGVIWGNIKQQLDREAIFNGSRFICAKKDKVNFGDSMNIFPKTTVKKLGDVIGLKKLELDEKFKKGKGVKEVTALDIEYCLRDCEIVYRSLLKIFEMVQSVRPTLAGLSLLYYRRFFMPFAFMYNKELSDKFFDSYYGGRVECFKLGVTHSFKYDINSMYPWAMREARFPNPKFLKEVKNPTIDKFNWALKSKEGMAELEVEHTNRNFGFLPVRHDSKLLFPTGKITGSWCFPEIRLALKRRAIKIIKVKKLIYSYPMDSPFKKFSVELYNKRMQQQGIEKEITKLLLNSLYGKFGQRIKFRDVYMDELDFDLVEKLKEKNIPYELKFFNAKRKDCYIHIFDQNKSKVHTICPFPAYITSLARVYLLEQMIKYEKYNVTYCDTDCICVEKELPLKDSVELGEFKKEHNIITEIYGNKNYSELLPDKSVSKKIKGIPKKALEISPNIYTFTKLIKTKQGIRQQLITGTPIEIKKVLKNEYTKRIKTKHGRTKPVHF